jgi:hypothetical protein
MEDAFGVMRGSLASRSLRQFRERAGSRNECVNEFASHSSRNSSKGADGNTVFCFSLFELLDGLSGCAQFLAYFALANAKSLAYRGDPSSGGTGWQAPREL